VATVDSLFKNYLRLIEPSEEAVERAAFAHGPLRADLAKDPEYGPYVERTLLSGSYGRDTATFFIKDVDIIVQTNFTLEDLNKQQLSGETEQQCLLRLTKEAIDRTEGRVARTRTARRSIHVKLPAEINNLGKEVPELTLDIVPVRIPLDQDADPMIIADRELQAWFFTYPNTQLSDSCKRNDRSYYIVDRHSYKPLVKIFKAWKKVHFHAQKTPKGFVLECLTATFYNPDAQHWLEAIRDLWQNIADAWSNPDGITQIPTVRDISNSSPHWIDIAKTVEESQKVIRTIHQHLNLVKQALAEADSDVAQAAKTLQRVFGDDYSEGGIYFPLPKDLDENFSDDSETGGKSLPTIMPSRSNIKEAPAFG
jgi:hypothetical protein